MGFDPPAALQNFTPLDDFISQTLKDTLKKIHRISESVASPRQEGQKRDIGADQGRKNKPLDDTPLNPLDAREAPAIGPAPGLALPSRWTQEREPIAWKRSWTTQQAAESQEQQRGGTTRPYTSHSASSSSNNSGWQPSLRHDRTQERDDRQLNWRERGSHSSGAPPEWQSSVAWTQQHRYDQSWYEDDRYRQPKRSQDSQWDNKSSWSRKWTPKKPRNDMEE